MISSRFLLVALLLGSMGSLVSGQTSPSVIIPATLTPATAVVGVPYTSGTFTVSPTPGNGAIWSVGAGLPPGIAEPSVSGVLQPFITGTPTQAGVFSFTVTANIGGASGIQKTYTLTVNPSLTITTLSIPTASVGLAYGAQINASGGVPPYSWSMSPTSVNGLTLSASGALTGSPQSAGTFAFTAIVTDSSDNTANRAFTLSTLAVSTSSLPAGTRGSPYTANLTVAGGTGPFSWAIATGSLPAGLNLDSSTGAISGTPTANSASSSFTVQVADATSASARASLSITINGPALTIPPATLPGGTVGTAYTTSLTATGGATPYTWSVTQGTLPAGLTLSTAGVIAGTPTAAGTSSFTVQARDSATTPATATANLSITIGAAAPLSVTITPTGSTGPGQQPLATITLSTPATQALTGTLTLTFASSVGGDDQMVRFSDGSRTEPFTIAAGSTQGVLQTSAVKVITGTVAGTITITASLLAGTVNVTPTPAPTIQLTVNKTPPVITRVTITQGTGAGAGTLSVAVTGFSSPRDMKSVTFHFKPTSTTTLAQNDVTVDVSTAFAAWYATSASNTFGSQFTLTVPFTFQGASFPVAALTVDMTNSVNISNPSSSVSP